MIAYKRYTTPNALQIFISIKHYWKVIEIYFNPFRINITQRFTHPEMSFEDVLDFIKKKDYNIIMERRKNG